MVHTPAFTYILYVVMSACHSPIRESFFKFHTLLTIYHLIWESPIHKICIIQVSE